MPVELKLLVWSAALTFVQMPLQIGLPELAGNREALPQVKGWAGRARRAHLNMLESIVLFAAPVLTAVAAQRTNSVTAIGA
jgi:uncharacterized MAPEG superfamily protein